jgi:hypothetical protein
MRIRTRKLVGTIALLRAGDRMGAARDGVCAIRAARAERVVAALFYAIAGLGWVLPAMPW